MADSQEFVAYNESSPGFLLPIIAIQRSNGTSSFRDMTRDDLSRIPDDVANPGGWIFKKSNSSNTWSRRFAVLRGAFMFYFRSPQAERPVGIIPLTDCEVGLPSEDNSKVKASTEGFEFEIRNFLGHTVRMYALSSGERDSWMRACQERIDSYRTVAAPLVVTLPPAPGQTAERCNIFITPCELSPNMNATRSAPPPPPPGGPVVMGYVNPLQAPSLSPGGEFPPPPPPVYVDQYNYQPPVSPPPPQLQKPQTPPKASPQVQVTPPVDPQHQQVHAEPIVLLSGHNPNPHPHPHQHQHSSHHHDNSSYYNNSNSAFGDNGSASSTVYSHPGLDYTADSYDPLSAPAPAGLEGGYEYSDPHPNLHSNNNNNASLPNEMIESLEQGLQGKFTVQQQASQREARAHEKYASQAFLAAERDIEARNPLRLAELFRMMLFFVNEELIIDPQPEARIQIPHVKGVWAENMLVSVYQHYCNKSNGFMSLEELVYFLEDSAILKTHTPHDEEDEPLAEFKALLEPQELLSSIPRGLGAPEGGKTVESAYLAPNNAKIISQSHQASDDAVRRSTSRRLSTTNATNYEDDAEDAFVITFTHFYDILLRITEIVYPELWLQDRTVAMNKLLQESILPLYSWTQGHSKLGSDDVLVREERIPLLMITYAPNLWKVFLLYAQDVHAKIPELDLPFPQCAQDVEKQLFGVPKGAPVKPTDPAAKKTEPFIMTQAAVLRVCTDYGFIPHLVSKDEVKQLVEKLNGEKVLRKGRSTTTQHQQHSHTGYHTNKNSFVRTRNPSLSSSMSLGSSSFRRGKDNNLEYAPGLAGGLGFSEFIELIASIAVIGMSDSSSYHALFPTPFAKVLSILTSWGLADLAKLEEVRAITSKSVF